MSGFQLRFVPYSVLLEFTEFPLQVSIIIVSKLIKTFTLQLTVVDYYQDCMVPLTGVEPVKVWILNPVAVPICINHRGIIWWLFLDSNQVVYPEGTDLQSAATPPS